MTALSHIVLNNAIKSHPKWERTNFEGRRVSLRAGVVCGAASTLATAVSAAKYGKKGVAAALLTGVGAAAGYVDDMDQGRHDGATVAKGLRGHIGALKRGHVTTGMAKLLAIGGGGAICAFFAPRRTGVLGLVDYAASAATIAAGTNLVNLFDLRPLRARKIVGIMAAGALANPGVGGALAGSALAGSLCDANTDARRQTMLGDVGAGALGTQVSLALAYATPPNVRIVLAAVLVGANLVSEKVSFSQIIAANPVLNALDKLGRS
ncbi:MAG: hypothetical protein Q4A71_00080 [Actinomycetaceae bacterium]|nr:hypothetical protein [Actinomycetaceae bacterium]